MPRPALPPTPAPSTDIKGQQCMSIDQSEQTFVLPPSAVGDGSKGQSPDEDMTGAGETSTPAGSVEQTGAASSPQNHANARPDISLPPPPSRSRKIIQVQMKPKSQEKQRSSSSSQPRRSARAAEAQAADKSGATDTQTQAQRTPSVTPTGKKTAGTNTAAGRKVARKTAHSIIERRRRSKMNEEFGVLKDLIPACRGYEMHKLAILQASIDYLRYLERCVTELKANQGNHVGAAADIPSREESSERISSLQADLSDDSEQGDGEENNNEMEVDETGHEQEPEPEPEPEPEREAGVEIETEQPWPKSMYRYSPGSSVSGTTAITSPAFSAYSQSRHRPSTANLPSPIFGPVWSHDGRKPSYSSGYDYSGGRPSYSNSTQTSPSILPMTQSIEQSEDMNEASAALLMLNAKDRRNQAPIPSAPGPAAPPTKQEKSNGRRGMSVKDLLRT